MAIPQITSFPQSHLGEGMFASTFGKPGSSSDIQMHMPTSLGVNPAARVVCGNASPAELRAIVKELAAGKRQQIRKVAGNKLDELYWHSNVDASLIERHHAKAGVKAARKSGLRSHERNTREMLNDIDRASRNGASAAVRIGLRRVESAAQYVLPRGLSRVR
jgi:hypothetical protein